MNLGGYNYQGTDSYYKLMRCRFSTYQCLKCKADIIMQYKVKPIFCPHCGLKFGKHLIVKSDEVKP